MSTVAFIVDHPQRDLAGIVLTAFELSQRGVTSYLVPHNLAEREVFAMAPDLVVLNYFRGGNEGLARRLLQAEICFGVLDSEGAVWEHDSDYTSLVWHDIALRRQLRFVCMWGKHLADYLVKQDVLAPEQITVTGCPRFDFYHERWRSVLCVEPEARRLPRILINTNFSTTNPRFATVEQHLQQARAVLDVTAETWEQMVVAESAALAATLDLAQRLSRDYPHADIVVRPHPFEDPAVYSRQLASAPNITVDNRGPVQPEILRAAVVIQRGCTTGIEARLANVPTLSPQWIQRPERPLVQAVSVSCQNYEELRTHVDAAIHRRGVGQSNGCEMADVLEQRFHCMDGNAHRRAADAISAALSDAVGPSIARCRRIAYGLDQHTGWSPLSLGRLARYAFGLSPNWSFRQWKEALPPLKRGKAFAVAEVQTLLDRIAVATKDAAHRVRPLRAEPASYRVLRRASGGLHSVWIHAASRARAGEVVL